MAVPLFLALAAAAVAAPPPPAPPAPQVMARAVVEQQLHAPPTMGAPGAVPVLSGDEAKRLYDRYLDNLGQPLRPNASQFAASSTGGKSGQLQ